MSGFTCYLATVGLHFSSGEERTQQVQLLLQAEK